MAKARRFLAIIAGLAAIVLLAESCKKPNESTTVEPKPNREPGAQQLDVCGLIPKADMEAVIGSRIVETKPSGRMDAGLRFSQCYYLAEEAAKSVSLALTDRDPSVRSNRGAKENWEEIFGRFEKEEAGEKENESDKAKKESLREQKGVEEEARPPRKIAGVGDEALWSGNRVGGALYVLRKSKDAFIRVSVGGPGNEQEKLDKSKKLALKALERL